MRFMIGLLAGAVLAVGWLSQPPAREMLQVRLEAWQAQMRAVDESAKPEVASPAPVPLEPKAESIATQDAERVAARAAPAATPVTHSSGEPVTDPAATPAPDPGAIPAPDPAREVASRPAEPAAPVAVDETAFTATSAPPGAGGEQGSQVAWTAFRNEVSASGFADWLAQETGHPFEVVKRGVGHFDVIFSWESELERQRLLDQIAAYTGHRPNPKEGR